MMENMESMWLVGVALVTVWVVYVVLNQQIQALEVRIKHMSKRMKQLEAEVTLEEPAINEELRRLIAEGEEIRAVKAVRVAFGYSLLEAKQYIDGLKENN